jgi:hypothetical protein
MSRGAAAAGIGVRRFELRASWSQTKRSTGLSYTPLREGAEIRLTPLDPPGQEIAP